ncbi:hypothetical protein LENED_010364 [Lentinula edodes]|uniref:Uncharacterized protein n=1 Tax=Lentinula edodes TaxID=5353 RepID=A0A1Q3EM79_LENED|nr:hypothetical protein LENED_010364 [Lentinula edodes]
MFLRSFRAGTRSFARRSLCQPAPVHCLFPSKKRVSSVPRDVVHKEIMPRIYTHILALKYLTLQRSFYKL